MARRIRGRRVRRAGEMLIRFLELKLTKSSRAGSISRPCRASGARRCPSIRRTARRLRRRTSSVSKDYLRRAGRKKTDRVRDPGAASLAFLATLHSYVFLQHVIDVLEKPLPLSEYLDTVIEVWTRGAIVTERDTPMRSTTRFLALCLLCLPLAMLSCRAKETGGVHLNGRIEAPLVDLAPKVAGRVVEVQVREGDRVKAGDLLVRLDLGETALCRRPRSRAALDSAQAHYQDLAGGSRRPRSRRPRPTSPTSAPRSTSRSASSSGRSRW